MTFDARTWPAGEPYPDEVAAAYDDSLRLQAEYARPQRRYRTIVVDPPWSYSNLWKGGRELSSNFFKGGTDRGAACMYDVMTPDDMAAVPVGQWADVDAHLYLWTTNAFMDEAYPMARAWGFQPKTILTWCKNQIGMGMYFRNTTEHVLFCVRGSLKCARKDVVTHFTAPRGSHSEKPSAFYDIVESMSPGPYLDVFARKMRLGWDSWGDGIGADYAPAGIPTPNQLRARKR